MENQNEEFNTHHRRPKALGGTDELRNLSRVKACKHRAWHVLFSIESETGAVQPMNPLQIAQAINNTYLDPDYKLVLVKTDEFNSVLKTSTKTNFVNTNHPKFPFTSL